jgi:hypothetical protein
MIGATAVPFVLEGLFWLFGSMSGDWPAIPTMFAKAGLYLIGRTGYVVCLPILISACMLLVTLGIPLRIKLVMATVELPACALLFWEVGRLGVLVRSLS